MESISQAIGPNPYAFGTLPVLAGIDILFHHRGGWRLEPSFRI
jgi:hypothetical protein